MKSSIYQLTAGVVEDNRNYINGNAAEYLLNNAENEEFGWQWYLTSKEALDFDMNDETRKKHIEEITEFIKENFDYEVGNIEDEEEDEELTYDIRFDDENDSETKGFEESIEYCKMYIKTNNSSNNETFAQFAGGTATIVCNETEEDIETIIIK